MDAFELPTRAPRQEAEELGPEPAGTQAERGREERWGAVVLLAGLADDDAALLRQAARETAAEWTNKEAAPLLVDAATLAGPTTRAGQSAATSREECGDG
jgi:hypothetical protein